MLGVVTLILSSFGLPFTQIAKPLSVEAATSPSVSALEKKKKELERLAAQKEAEAKRQAQIKVTAEAKAKEVAGQITVLQGNIQQTQGNIVGTTTEIERKNQEIAQFQSDLSRLETQQGALLRQMYIMRSSMPDSLAVFADQPIADRAKEDSRFSSLKRSVATLFVKTTSAKLAVEQRRDELVKKNNDLNNLKAQQDAQKRGLATYQQTQVALKQNAEAAVVKLEADAQKARQQAAAVESQISAALSAAIRNSAKGIYGSGAGVGQRVSRGDFVGIQGSTGFSTGDHVHFEVRANDVPVNPRPYLNNGTISWPLRNFIVTQEFGRTSFSNVYAGGIHTGIDIAGPSGSPVYAPADGVVILNGCPSSCSSGYGRAWAMQLDNGLVVMSAHLRL